MAYTKTPEQDTYKTMRINFVGNPQSRNGVSINKDQRFVNIFPEVVKTVETDTNEYYLKTRAGLEFQLANVPGEGRGLFFFNTHWWVAVGNQLYRDGVAVQTLSSSTGKVGFTLYNGTYDALIAFDGIAGWVIKTDNSITKITDVDFPTPHLPTPVFIDGYLLCVKAGTADIYNSKLEDPLDWDPANVITAEMYPDMIVSLVKNKNYVCAVGQKTTEFFYDAGIASGSPLARNDSFVQQIGTPSLRSIVNTHQDLILVGVTSQGGRTVWVMNGVKLTEVGIEPVRQALDAEGDNLVNCSAYTTRSKGHEFYVLNLTQSNRTLVFDVGTKVWHEWANASGVGVLPVEYGADSDTGSSYLLHSTNGNVFKLLDGVATDEYTSGVLTPITSSITTTKLDFGSLNKKTCSRFSLVGDSPNGSTPTTCTVEWTDDDYNTWTVPKTLTITDIMMTITQLGGFRRRAFRIIYNQPYTLRLTGFEVDINVGRR